MQLHRHGSETPTNNLFPSVWLVRYVTRMPISRLSRFRVSFSPSRFTPYIRFPLMTRSDTRHTNEQLYVGVYFFLFHEYSAHTQTNVVVARTGTRTDVMEPTVRRKPGRESPSVFGAGDIAQGWRQPPLILRVMRLPPSVPFILFRDLLRQRRITAAPYTAYIAQRA